MNGLFDGETVQSSDELVEDAGVFRSGLVAGGRG